MLKSEGSHSRDGDKEGKRLTQSGIVAGGKWKAGSRTYGVQRRDNVCVSHNMSAKKKTIKTKQKKKWHKSRITDGGLTQSLTVSHLPLSHAVKPHRDCALY